MSSCDALVVGAGPAGSSAAILLARRGWNVAIVEKAAFPRRKVCGEFISATTWPVLRGLGVDALLADRAGPAVRRVGWFAGESILSCPMPAPGLDADAWGRALEREHLDAALLASAARCGAQVWQPWSLETLEGRRGNYRAMLANARGESQRLEARIVIAAHGSWERGAMATHLPRPSARASDLLGFKAHYRGARLPPGLMPLVLFPGGYGGMVHTGDGLVSFSCCIRRNALAACRRARPGMDAGEAVIDHVLASCRGVREAIAPATREGPWLSAGPIRPGIRARALDGIFAVGNAAGEAHPLVAEGISMAIQSAWLLCGRLGAPRGDWGDNEIDAVGRAYARDWRRQFAGRVHAAALFAFLATSPWTAGASAATVRRIPALLSWGARWSGKARTLRGLQSRDA